MKPNRIQRATVAIAALLLLAYSQRVSAATWKFLVYGDSRGTSTSNPINTQILGELATQTVAENPAFVLFGGDLAYSGSLANYTSWSNTMQSVYAAGIPICAVAGNHESADLSDFKSMFISPFTTVPFTGMTNLVVDTASFDGRSYSFNFKNAMFLCMDNYSNSSTSAHCVNQPFLAARLAARNPTNTPLVFATWHEPAFKAGQDTGLENKPAQRNATWTSLTNAGCRVVFNGHDHLYATARLDNGDGNASNDTYQVVVGTAGAPSYTLAYSGDTGSWTVVPVSSETNNYGYVRVIVDDVAHTVSQTWVHRTGANTYADTSSVLTYTYGSVAAGQLGVSPTSTFSSSGTVGGPFSPASQVYSLTNSGNASLNWTASKTQPWLTLSSASGSLAAGASANVTASINGSANSLGGGIYSDNIGFTNTANGAGNTTRPVTLTVNTLPVASFTANPTSGVAPLFVTFTDTSTGSPTSWVWDFGDTGTSTLQNTNHTYAAGTYTARLIASNAGGSSTNTQAITVITPLASWQNHYWALGASDPNAAPDLDPYGKGISNTNQFLAGFTPTNPAAYPHILSAQALGNDIQITYLGANGDTSYVPGVASRQNVLEYTSGIAGSYSNNFLSAGQTNILSGGNGLGVITNMTDYGGATNIPSRFYRVRVLVP